MGTLRNVGIAHFTTGLVVVACLLAVSGCGKSSAPTPSPKEVAESDPAAEAREWVSLHMEAAQQALERGDVGAAAIELQGANNLLQQVQTQQRQAGKPATALPAEPLAEMAEKHQAAAELTRKNEDWDAAVAHYQTAASLLSLAATRESDRVAAEATQFSDAYAKAYEDLRKWYEQAQKNPEMTDEDRAALQQEYQEKQDAAKETWDSRREEHEAKIAAMREEVAETTAELTRKRCATYTAISEVYEAKGDERQAQYYTTMSYQELARMLERNNDYAGAAAEYKRWLEARPDDVSARMGYARCLEQQGKQDEAAAQFREVLKKNPKDTNTRFQLASLLERQQKWDDAVAQWKEILKVDRERLDAITGDDPLSQNRRRQLKTSMGSRYLSIATAYRSAEKKAEAKAAYAKAAELDPRLKAQIPEGYGG